MTKTVSLRMDETVINHLKKLARRMSVEQEKDISYNDLIVEAVTEKLSGLNNKERKEY